VTVDVFRYLVDALGVIVMSDGFHRG
jgi:hypothetical protein